jgi:hypothetical protein
MSVGFEVNTLLEVLRRGGGEAQAVHSETYTPALFSRPPPVLLR